MLSVLLGILRFFARAPLWEVIIVLIVVFAVSFIVISGLAVFLKRKNTPVATQKKWARLAKTGVFVALAFGVVLGWLDQRVGQGSGMSVVGSSNIITSKSVIGTGNTVYMDKATIINHQAAIRSFLIPANDPMPDINGYNIGTNDRVAFVGNMTTAFPPELKSFSVSSAESMGKFTGLWEPS